MGRLSIIMCSLCLMAIVTLTPAPAHAGIGDAIADMWQSVVASFQSLLGADDEPMLEKRASVAGSTRGKPRVSFVDAAVPQKMSAIAREAADVEIPPLLASLQEYAQESQATEPEVVIEDMVIAPSPDASNERWLASDVGEEEIAPEFDDEELGLDDARAHDDDVDSAASQANTNTTPLLRKKTRGLIAAAPVLPAKKQAASGEAAGAKAFVVSEDADDSGRDALERDDVNDVEDSPSTDEDTAIDADSEGDVDDAQDVEAIQNNEESAASRDAVDHDTESDDLAADNASFDYGPIGQPRVDARDDGAEEAAAELVDEEDDDAPVVQRVVMAPMPAYPGLPQATNEQQLVTRRPSVSTDTSRDSVNAVVTPQIIVPSQPVLDAIVAPSQRLEYALPWRCDALERIENRHGDASLVQLCDVEKKRVMVFSDFRDTALVCQLDAPVDNLVALMLDGDRRRNDLWLFGESALEMRRDFGDLLDQLFQRYGIGYAELGRSEIAYACSDLFRSSDTFRLDLEHTYVAHHLVTRRDADVEELAVLQQSARDETRALLLFSGENLLTMQAPALPTWTSGSDVLQLRSAESVVAITDGRSQVECGVRESGDVFCGRTSEATAEEASEYRCLRADAEVIAHRELAEQVALLCVDGRESMIEVAERDPETVQTRTTDFSRLTIRRVEQDASEEDAADSSEVEVPEEGAAQEWQPEQATDIDFSTRDQ